MLAGAVVVDLGDAVANGVAAFAAVVSVIALFVADSRAKEANSIAVDANKTAREARDIAKEANSLTREQIEYTVKADRDARQIDFREVVPPLLKFYSHTTDQLSKNLAPSGSMEGQYLKASVIKLEKFFPGQSLFDYNGLIYDTKTILDKYQLFHFKYYAGGRYEPRPESEAIASNLKELVNAAIVYIGQVFRQAYQADYYLDEFQGANRVVAYFKKELDKAYKQIEAYRIVQIEE